MAEMSFENEIGFEVEIEQDMRTDQWLFSQTGGFILEADNINLPAIISIMSGYGIPVTKLGRTTAHQVMVFGNVIHLPLAKVKESWHTGLRDKLK
jgi:selenophosphate synthetase-related protein